MTVTTVSERFRRKGSHRGNLRRVVTDREGWGGDRANDHVFGGELVANVGEERPPRQPDGES
jgi:hypothetical protein